MGIEAEHRATAQLRRPGFDDADVEIAVLDRPGELPVLERRPHHGVLARRHAAAKDQRLGPPAHSRTQRPDEDLARPGAGSGTGRISPAPGSRSQNASASLATGLTQSSSV